MSAEIEKLDKTLLLETSVSGFFHILIVDDDVDFLNLLSEHLGERNFFVDTCESGEIAKEKIEDERYSLIILDVNLLGGISGRELLNYIKDRYPRIAVIMITGAPEVDAAVSLIKDGADDYLSKPINMVQLNMIIHDVLKKRAIIQVDPIIQAIMENIPEEYSIAKILCTTLTSIILLVEKESKYYVMKILKYDILDDSNVKKIQRFFREAQVMRSISHPNIVKVYEYRCHDNQLPFIISEYIPFSALTKEMMDNMDFKEKLIFVHKLADALWTVHKRGISHRDIKPSNIMVTSSGDPKLTDFGIAGIKDSSLTITNEILGSPRYMSPEAFLSFRKTDSRSDIFSLGLVLYEMLTGHPPFTGNSINQIIDSVNKSKPMRPGKLNPEISPGVERILAKMLAKSPDKRYKNAALLAIDLKAAIDGKSVLEESNCCFFSSIFRRIATHNLRNTWTERI